MYKDKKWINFHPSTCILPVRPELYTEEVSIREGREEIREVRSQRVIAEGSKAEME